MQFMVPPALLPAKNARFGLASEMFEKACEAHKPPVVSREKTDQCVCEGCLQKNKNGITNNKNIALRACQLVAYTLFYSHLRS